LKDLTSRGFREDKGYSAALHLPSKCSSAEARQGLLTHTRAEEARWCTEAQPSCKAVVLKYLTAN